MLEINTYIKLLELPNDKITAHVNVCNSRRMMLRYSLLFNFFRKNTVRLGLSTKHVYLVSSLKFIILCLFCFSEFLFLGPKLKAESHDKQLQKYVKNANSLEANKLKKARVAAQKTNGRVIKYYLIKKSVVQSKKAKAKTAAVKMVDAGLITSSMVKKNRWFVQKPFETSYSKISNIKLYEPPRLNAEENEKISRKAFVISKKHARDTGPIKPETIYSVETSRGAQKMTKARAIDGGSTRPGIVYTESSGREAMNISTTRARKTGPVKPESIYPESVSREAKGMTNERSKKFTVARKGLVYSAEMLKSMGRRPPIKNTSSKSASSVEESSNTGG